MKLHHHPCTMRSLKIFPWLGGTLTIRESSFHCLSSYYFKNSEVGIQPFASKAAMAAKSLPIASPCHDVQPALPPLKTSKKMEG